MSETVLPKEELSYLKCQCFPVEETWDLEISVELEQTKRHKKINETEQSSQK